MGIGTPSRPNLTAEEWNSGSCDIMAVALHRAYGLPIEAEFQWGFDKDGKEQQAYLVHAWVVLPDGRMFDASGPAPAPEPLAGDDGKDPNDPWVEGCRIVRIRDDDPDLLDIREEDDYVESIDVSDAYGYIARHLAPVLSDLGLEPVIPGALSGEVIGCHM